MLSLPPQRLQQDDGNTEDCRSENKNELLFIARNSPDKKEDSSLFLDKMGLEGSPVEFKKVIEQNNDYV